MSSKAPWEPFEITKEEYWQVIQRWEPMDIENQLADNRFRYDLTAR